MSFCFRCLLLLVLGSACGTLGAQHVLFQDDFTLDARRWPLHDDAVRRTSIEAGQLRLAQRSGEHSLHCQTEVFLQAGANFAIGAHLILQPGPLNNSYGICWSGDDTGTQYYAFLLRPEGYAAVVQVAGETSRYLLAWTRVRKLAPPGTGNDLRIRKQGWMYYFDVNGKEVGSVPFQKLLGHHHGIVLRGSGELAVETFYIQHPPVDINLVSGPLLRARKAPLDTTLNTPSAHETAPHLAPGGRRLYFTRADTGATGDIWLAEVQGDSMWGSPQPVAALNNSGHNAVVRVLDRAGGLLLASRYRPDGSDGGDGLSVVRRDGDGWSRPESRTPPGYSHTGAPGTWFLSDDETLLLFAADMPGGYGKEDLYVCLREAGGRWSDPRNLGPAVNTPGTEFSPWLDPDGLTLYFASNGHPGYGGADIFRSSRLSNTWTQWSRPENLGPRINGRTWDGWYTPLPGRPRHVYMASVDSLRGDYDLYGVRIPEDLTQLPYVLVHGTVYHVKTGAPLAATVFGAEVPGGQQARQVQTDSSGRYHFMLPFGKAYQLYADRPGYYAVTDTLDLRRYSVYREVQRDLYLSPIEIGDTIRLKELYFERATAIILQESYPELDRLVLLLRSLPTLQIEIHGHTDNIGSEATLQALSEARAAVVRQYLIDHGIEATRLGSRGFGSSRPVADNADPLTRPLNRRVEFRVVRR
ncbi:MAG: hypothetical protein OHK0039_06740 [Bacteroidia bacterium]